MKRPLSLGVLIIPVLSAAAALALIVLALMPGPDTHEPDFREKSPEAAAARETAVGGGNPARLDPAMPVPAPRP